MTDQLNQWVDKVVADKPDWDTAHALSRKTANFWIRAFCDEVEKRAKLYAQEQPGHDPNFVDYSTAFEDLKHELLGLEN